MNLSILLAEGTDAARAASINWHSFFFLLFAMVSCGMALAVLFTSNIVRMAFYLTVSLGAVAGLFILAGAHFVGAMQLMIYVGGTLVLLVFGVMLTAQAQFIEMQTRGGEWILAAIVGGSMLVVLLFAALGVDAWHAPSETYSASTEQDTTALGAALMGLRVDSLAQKDSQLQRGMSGYFIHFEIASVHLLVVLIGAAYLARARHTVGEGAPAVSTSTAPVNRRRGIFISAILLLATLFHIVHGALSFFMTSDTYQTLGLGLPVPEGWLWSAIGITHFALAFAYIAIMRWQQWGFFGLCGLAVVQGVFFAAAGAGTAIAIVMVVSAALWLAILFALLRIGGDRSVWSQME